MSLHRSLKTKPAALNQHRNVLTRAERITRLTEEDRFDPEDDESIFDVQKREMEKTSVLPMLPEDRILCSFQHIFAGGYAAGYYSYIWSEILDADAFQAFKETSLLDKETAARYRDEILSKGGTRPGMELYVSFRGREPEIGPLLEKRGLN